MNRCACFVQGIQKRVQVKCRECYVGLCIGALKCTTKIQNVPVALEATKKIYQTDMLKKILRILQYVPHSEAHQQKYA